MEALWSPALPLQWHTELDDDDAGAATVAVHGELDAQTAPLFRDHLDWLIALRRSPIVLDVGAVSFVDLEAYRVLAEVGQRCRADHRGLVLVRPSVALRRLLDVVGLPDGVTRQGW